MARIILMHSRIELPTELWQSGSAYGFTPTDQFAAISFLSHLTGLDISIEDDCIMINNGTFIPWNTDTDTENPGVWDKIILEWNY